MIKKGNSINLHKLGLYNQKAQIVFLQDTKILKRNSIDIFEILIYIKKGPKGLSKLGSLASNFLMGQDLLDEPKSKSRSRLGPQIHTIMYSFRPTKFVPY